jgi:NitT/TauT family transport system substrate-binding protein
LSALAVAVASLLLLSLCGCRGDAGDRVQQGRVRLQLNWTAEPEFGGFFAARERGLFAKEGLDVELVQGGPGIPVAQLAASGNVEFAVVAANQLLELRQQGGDLIALFAVFQGNPMGIMVHESTPYRTLEELWLSDATISLEEGLADFAWLSTVYPGGKHRVVPYSANLAQFAADTALAQQCFFTSEPVSLELQGTKTRVFMIGESGFDPYNAIVVTTRSFYAANETLCRSMVRACAHGWRSYLDDMEAIQVAMTKENPAMSRMAMDRSAERQRTLIETATTKRLGLGCMTQSHWRQTIEQLTSIGRLQQPIDAASVFVWHEDAGTSR